MEEGESVRLVPNPNYYRSAEGLPYLTSLTYKFLSGNNKTLPDGFEGCNIITDDVLSFDAVGAVDDAEAAGTLVEHAATAGVVSRLLSVSIRRQPMNPPTRSGSRTRACGRHSPNAPIVRRLSTN